MMERWFETLAGARSSPIEDTVARHHRAAGRRGGGGLAGALIDCNPVDGRVFPPHVIARGVMSW